MESRFGTNLLGGKPPPGIANRSGQNGRLTERATEEYVAWRLVQVDQPSKRDKVAQSPRADGGSRHPGAENARRGLLMEFTPQSA